MKAKEKDIELLEKQYEGRRPFRGEMHDHSAIGKPIRNERDM